jgi:hypothetical protein
MIRELIDAEVEEVVGGLTISGNGNNPFTITFNPQNQTTGGNATSNGAGNATGGNAGGQTFGPISF